MSYLYNSMLSIPSGNVRIRIGHNDFELTVTSQVSAEAARRNFLDRDNMGLRDKGFLRFSKRLSGPVKDDKRSWTSFQERISARDRRIEAI